MAADPIQPITNGLIQTQGLETTQSGAQASAVKTATAESFTTFIDQFAVNTMQIIRRNSQPLDERVRKRAKTDNPDEPQAEDENPIEVESSAEIAASYENKDPEIKAKSLQSLKEQISESDTPEDVLQKIIEAFPDPVMADAAFDYLLEVLPTALKEKIPAAREIFEKRFGRSLLAGKNIFDQSLKFAKEGLGSSSELRQAYAELTGDPKDALPLFEDLLDKFTFEKMKPAINFWLHALGADLKSKGSSIEPGELHKLIGETKTLQAILGVYRYFASKQRELILNLVRKETTATPEMNYQNLSALFVKVLQDNYPSPDKILFLKYDLKIDPFLHAQEAVLSIMCSAIKQVSPRLYKDLKHKEEVLNAFLIALEAIDNALDEK